MQSQLGELVEMVVIGGAASLISAGLVFGALTSFSFIDSSELDKDASGYLLTEPWRCFAAAGGFYALAYLLAYLASRLVHRRTEPAIVPGATSWTKAMRTDVPDGKVVSVQVELHDGRKLAGPLAAFTSAVEPNREIVLRQPIKAAAGPEEEPVDLRADFVALREEQIALVSGQYVNPKSG